MRPIGFKPSEELVYWALAANIPGRELSTREEYGIVFGTAARRTSHLARIKHVLQVCLWLCNTFCNVDYLAFQICLNSTDLGEEDDEDDDSDWEPPGEGQE